MRRIGFEGKLYWGAAGATATTELTIARDVSYKFDPTLVDTSDRASIVEYQKTGMLKFSLEFECNNNDSDAFVNAARVAAAAGGTMAFRTRDKTAGWGCDGDFNIALDESQALRDAQRMKIVATPNNDTRGMSWS